MTLQEFFDNFYRPLRLRGRSHKTAESYSKTLKAFGRWLQRDPTLEDLDELVISRYLEHRTNTVSPYTAERERTQICALAGLAAERHLIAHRPIVMPERLPDRVPKAWSLQQLRRLYAAAEQSPHIIVPGLFERDFFPSLFSVLWETGERIGAALGARWEDYHPPTLVVRAESRKGRKRDRCYRLSDATCRRLDAMPRVAERIFPWPEDKPLRIYDALKRIRKRAGITGDRQAFHQIRRSAASHFAAAGGDATAMLDHSSPTTTKRWYLDPRMTDQSAKPCDLLPPIVETPVS